VTQKIKDGEVFDAVIVSEPAMDVLDKEGIVNPESRVRLANTGMGVAVRAGAPVPDLSTPEAFKQALLAAKSVVYGDPTLPNQSGEKAEKILAKAGILDALKPKLRIVPGQAASQELIAKGEIELGLYNVSEIPEDKGLKLAGPVPAALQISTTYEGALMSDGAVAAGGARLHSFLVEPGRAYQVARRQARAAGGSLTIDSARRFPRLSRKAHTVATARAPLRRPRAGAMQRDCNRSNGALGCRSQREMNHENMPASAARR
jgi:molybdate transport system substrate-binding protein